MHCMAVYLLSFRPWLKGLLPREASPDHLAIAFLALAGSKTTPLMCLFAVYFLSPPLRCRPIHAVSPAPITGLAHNRCSTNIY